MLKNTGKFLNHDFVGQFGLDKHFIIQILFLRFWVLHENACLNQFWLIVSKIRAQFFSSTFKVAEKKWAQNFQFVTKTSRKTAFVLENIFFTFLPGHFNFFLTAI